MARLCWAVCSPGLWSLPLVSFSLPSLILLFFCFTKFGRVSSFSCLLDWPDMWILGCNWKNQKPGDVQASEWTIHSYVQEESLLALVYRRGHGRDGIHRGRKQHEWLSLWIPAIPRCLCWWGRRVWGRRGSSRLEQTSNLIAKFGLPPLWQGQTSNDSYNNNRKCSMMFPKNELRVHSNTWWTFLKMWDQMRTTWVTLLSLSLLLRANKPSVITPLSLNLN